MQIDISDFVPSINKYVDRLIDRYESVEALMTSTARPTAVIVDPFGSGSYLAPIFDKAGWDCIAVLSSTELPSVFTTTMRPEEYVEVLIPDDGLEQPLPFAE